MSAIITIVNTIRKLSFLFKFILLFLFYGAKIKETPAVLGQRLEEDFLFYLFR